MDLYYPDTAMARTPARHLRPPVLNSKRAATWRELGAKRSSACWTRKPRSSHVNRKLAEKVAQAVLYEGYMLYPYRSFGHQEPAALELRHSLSAGIPVRLLRGTERSVRCTSECLLMTGANATVEIELRLLALTGRHAEQQVEERFEPSLNGEGHPDCRCGGRRRTIRERSISLR